MKNVNFQYAMKLWTFLRDNYNIGLAEEEEHQDYMDSGELKQFIDDYKSIKTTRQRQEIKDVTIKYKSLEK